MRNRPEVASSDVKPPASRLDWCLRILFGLGVLMIPLLLMSVATIREHVLVIVEQIRTGGLLGLGAYFVLMLFAGSFSLPIWLPGVVAGYAFGFGMGIGVGLLGVVLHFLASFTIGRFVLGKQVRKRLGSWKEWPRIELALGRAGVRLVGLLRATPVLPQNLLGFALGTTSLPLRSYLLGSVGIVPMLVLHTYAGSSVARVEEIFASTGNAWTAAAGLAVSGVAVWLVTRTASRVLRESLDEKSGEEPLPVDPPPEAP
jgi:uncharacterized membrane protein YdjX (TVP38/TMEM64 family)